MNTKLVGSVVAALVIGMGLGYCVFGWCWRYGERTEPRSLKTMSAPMMVGHSMDSMDHQMMGMTDRMKGKTGDELDKIFLQDMIVHHQGAVEMAQILAKDTKRPELQKMSADIIRVQTAEIAQMQQWLDAWFK